MAAASCVSCEIFSAVVIRDTRSAARASNVRPVSRYAARSPGDWGDAALSVQAAREQAAREPADELQGDGGNGTDADHGVLDGARAGSAKLTPPR